MQIIPCENYQEMSTLAADLVQEELVKKPKLLFCAATGSSPAGLYEEMGARYKIMPGLFDRMRILKLDEWGGVPEEHPVTCEYFIRKRLLEPLAIPEKRYLTFRSDPKDPEEECLAIRNTLAKEGPIDLCVLGLGQNGHLGLNEPASHLEPFCHVAQLSELSLEHKMIASLEIKPRYGITLGMQEILSSRKIVLLVTGAGKKGMVNRLMEGKISTTFPASLLWTHGQVECFLDRSVQV
ncbi:MAG: galactosamine-6-phosphate isomerase [Bacteroidia bacterium]|nr:MAG: galactosamine-6-phosphate isomerase [Bacteroidia bacterium]